MKKYPGTCSQCSNKTIGYKQNGFSGNNTNSKKGKGYHAHKKGNYKCLSCQDVRFAKVDK